MLIILTRFAFSQQPNAKIKLGAEYFPIISEKDSKYIKSGWKVNGAYQHSLSNKFYLEGNLNFTQMIGKDSYDGFLSLKTPGFNLIGIGPSILYYPNKKNLFFAFGYNAQLSSFKNSSFVNNIQMELGLTIRNLSFSAGINSFFNKGSLTSYGIGLAYGLDLKK
ncbi:hypothetical protein [Pseudopedobacter sp.]|uniref:hypothetical protein n=1 Tax=Pseudopedobacter sp. TaxID=1936787 RepID=UPI003341B080